MLCSAPSVYSLKKAMQTYARQGGSSSIFINDDGLQLIPAADRDARIAFYENHDIGYVARPPHSDAPGGFRRAGRFKKASNMNYGLRLSLKLEKHLAALREKERNEPGSTGTGVGYPRAGAVFGSSSSVGGGPGSGSGIGSGSGSGASAVEEEDVNMSLEDKALALAVEEMFEESGKMYKPWAANGKAIRMGEIVLIVDSDTIVPEVGVFFLLRFILFYFSSCAMCLRLTVLVSIGLFP